MEQTISKRKQWLKRSGFIVGILGIAEIITWGLFYSDSEDWAALLTMSIYIVPLLVCLIVSWKWPFAGGIILVAIGSLLFIFFAGVYLLTPSTNPISELIWFAVTLFSALGLPYLLTGILFILSTNRSRKKTAAS